MSLESFLKEQAQRVAAALGPSIEALQTGRWPLEEGVTAVRRAVTGGLQQGPQVVGHVLGGAANDLSQRLAKEALAPFLQAHIKPPVVEATKQLVAELAQTPQGPLQQALLPVAEQCAHALYTSEQQQNRFTRWLAPLTERLRPWAVERLTPRLAAPMSVVVAPALITNRQSLSQKAGDSAVETLQHAAGNEISLGWLQGLQTLLRGNNHQQPVPLPLLPISVGEWGSSAPIKPTPAAPSVPLTPITKGEEGFSIFKGYVDPLAQLASQTVLNHVVVGPLTAHMATPAGQQQLATVLQGALEGPWGKGIAKAKTTQWLPAVQPVVAAPVTYEPSVATLTPVVADRWTCGVYEGGRAVLGL